MKRAFQARRLTDAINETIKQANNERIYDLWKARCFDKTYDEFKSALMIETTPAKAGQTPAETIKDSLDILDSFIPY